MRTKGEASQKSGERGSWAREAESIAKATCDKLLREAKTASESFQEAAAPEAFRDAALQAMAGAARAAGVVAHAVDAVSTALAQAGTIFPPAVIPAAFPKLFTLCSQIRERYKQHMEVLDKDLPDLRERVEALEGGLRDLARLRVLAFMLQGET